MPVKPPYLRKRVKRVQAIKDRPPFPITAQVSPETPSPKPLGFNPTQKLNHSIEIAR
jgi:hypothetical protein